MRRTALRGAWLWLALVTVGCLVPDEGPRKGQDEHLPPYVITDADRDRWANAEIVARNILGDDAPEDAIWQTRRMIFHDRESYPD